MTYMSIVTIAYLWMDGVGQHEIVLSLNVKESLDIIRDEENYVLVSHNRHVFHIVDTFILLFIRKS